MSPSPEEVQLLETIRTHWKLMLVEGIILLMLGFLAILIPAMATLGVIIFVGWLLLISGLIGLASTFGGRQAPGFWWSLLSALLAIAVGTTLVEWPINATISLTYIFIVFFGIEGIATIMFALEHRRQFSGRWEWMIASGLIDLVLTAIVIAGLPGTMTWAAGLLVGINMVFGGSALIAMAIHARANNLRTGARSPPLT